MPSYLVTGGAGFIGSHLVERLVKDGHRVTILDDFSTGLEANLHGLRQRIRVIRGDVRHLDTVRRAVEGNTAVFHHAALGSVPRSVSDPITSNAVNVDGTLNLLVAARDARVRRFIFASSSSVYGNTPILPKAETMPTNPLSPYALTKLGGEEYCRIFHRLYGLETVSLRYFNVFGPRQRPDSQYAAVIPRFITAILEGRQPQVHGDGLQSRDFTFVSNNVEANLLAADAPAERVAGHVFNIACNDQITLLQLINTIKMLVDSDVSPAFLPPRPGDVQHSWADIGLARDALGYAPKTAFMEGLRTTVTAFRKALSAL